MCSRTVRMCTKWPKREKHDFMKFQAPGRGGGDATKLFFYKNTFLRRGGAKILNISKTKHDRAF